MSREFKVTVKGEPISFSSSLSDAEAHHLLVNVLTNSDNSSASDFAKSLASKDVETMSKSQIAWVHRLVLHTPMKMSRTVAFIDALMRSTGSHTLTFDEFCITCKKTDVLRIRISDTNNTYVGKIDPKTGAFWTSSNLTFAIAVDLFCMESCSGGPAEFVRESGMASKRCCMCGLPLLGENSLKMGYDKICATRYSMPWKV
jgi:hypothetical protein